MRRLTVCVAVCLGACGGDDGAGAPDAAATTDDAATPDAGAPDTATATVGTAGGAIAIAGLTITFAPGAIAADTEITVTRTDDAAPAGYVANSPVYAFLPTGLTFTAAVTVAIDATGDLTDPTLQWTSDGVAWAPIAGAVAEGVVTATIDHFSGGFVGHAIAGDEPTGILRWDPTDGFNGLEVFGLIDTGAGGGIYLSGNYAEVFELVAPATGPTAVTMTLASDLAGGRLVRGPARFGAGFVVAGRMNNGVDAAIYDGDGALIRAVGTTVTGEGVGAVARDDGGVAVVGFQGSTVKVVYFDAGLTAAPVALTLASSFGRAIAPGVGSGVVVASQLDVFRIDGAGAVTWQKALTTTGSIVKVVRFGASYAVVGNFAGVPHVLLVADDGTISWQRSLAATPAGTAAAAGASVVDVGGVPHLWVGGSLDAAAFEWILDGAGAIVDGGQYGAGKAISAIGSGDDLLVGGISGQQMWTARHSLAYTFPTACATGAVTATASTSAIAATDTMITPTTLTATVTEVVVSPPALVTPATTDGCP